MTLSASRAFVRPFFDNLAIEFNHGLFDGGFGYPRAVPGNALQPLVPCADRPMCSKDENRRMKVEG